jgi:ankyrin repeat protein
MLYEGATTNNLKQVRSVLLTNPPPDVINATYGPYRRTALHEAAAKGYIDIVKAFIDAHAKVDIRDDNGDTAFHDSCDKGHLDVVKCLVETHMDPDIQNVLGFTGLINACERGHIEIAQYLVTAGANLNIQNGQDYTALHHACAQGNIAIVKLLVDAGADATTITTKAHDRTAGDVASMYGELEIVQYILSRNGGKGQELIALATRFLLPAAQYDHGAVVECLLRQGADPSHKFSGGTAWEVALREHNYRAISAFALIEAEGSSKFLSPAAYLVDGGVEAIDAVIKFYGEVWYHSCGSNVSNGQLIQTLHGKG